MKKSLNLVECFVTATIATIFTLACAHIIKKQMHKSRHLTPNGLVLKNKKEKCEVIDLNTLPPELIPVQLRLDSYVSIEHQKNFEHGRLFESKSHVFAILDGIHSYITDFFRLLSIPIDVTTLNNTDQSDKANTSDTGGTMRFQIPNWVGRRDTAIIYLYPGVNPLEFAPDKVISSAVKVSSSATHTTRLIVCTGAKIYGGTFDLTKGSIYIGEHVCIEPNTVIKGPCILGSETVVRSGAYLRGDVIIGRKVVLGGELKNAIIMDHAELPHPGYCGDSICGVKSHFGNQVTSANLNLFTGIQGNTNIKIHVHDVQYDTGRKKIGVILGDYSQLGCSSVTDPCTLIQMNTVVYSLTRLKKGIYGPRVIIKNRPMEAQVISIVPFHN